MAINRINISAGHNPDGKIASGAIGIIKESTEARNVVAESIKLFKQEKKTVYDCTCNNGTGQRDVLQKICAKCNAHSVDLDISVHFNSHNGSAKGVEVLYINDNVASIAARVSKTISNQLGLVNRGIKKRTDLYYLKHTKAPAILIECCFCDNKGDVSKYSASKMAKAIVEGVLNKSIGTISTPIDNRKAVKTLIVADGEVDKKAADVLKWKITDAVVITSKDFNKYKAEKSIGIGGPACKATKCDVELIGEDRYDTMIKAAEYAKSYKK